MFALHLIEIDNTAFHCPVTDGKGDVNIVRKYRFVFVFALYSVNVKDL